MGQAVRLRHHVAEEEALPPAVLKLFPRMRELASVVYLNGGATARDVQASIQDPLTICGVRTLLNRLVRRGILQRRRSGRHTEVLYLPAIVTPDLQRTALIRFVDRNFDGSIVNALQTVSRLV
jgi:predicted transcriptional regulator